MTLLMLSACTLDSFDMLFNLTSDLKKNLAVEAGIISVDISDLIDSLDESFSSLMPLSPDENGSYKIGNHYFVFKGQNCILPPVSSALLNRIAAVPSDSKASQKVRNALEGKVDDELSSLADSSVEFINEVLANFSSFESYEALKSFHMEKKDSYTKSDILRLRIIMHVFSSSLVYFEDGQIVCIEAVKKVFSGEDQLESAYIDHIASSLGLCKSVSHVTGDSTLYMALDKVLQMALGVL